MSFTERLLSLIYDKGISRNKMLKDLGLGTGTFGTWETRKTIPNGETIAKLATYFNVSTDYLLGKTENPTTTNDSEVKDLQDPVTAEILDIISKLSPEGQDWAISQLRSLVELEAKKGK